MLIIFLALLCLIPQVPSAAALVAGIAVALTVGNPHIAKTKVLGPKIMAWSLVGIGAGMNLDVVMRAGAQGFAYTLAGIALAMGLGMWLARRLKISGDSGLLISVGTSICGGSAIAAVTPAIGAKSEDVSIALGTVFCLNAVALLIFPPIGHWLGLDQSQFGLWAALAIHDTSSVVGASMQYGPDALQIGTTVKLARALWIVPLVWLIGHIRERQLAKSAAGAERPKAKRPWFVLGFVAMAALVTYVPALKETGEIVALVAKRTLVVTLFLIGANLTPAALRSVGVRPLIHGVSLWVVVSVATLGAILAGWIH
jgi:uncharacterized integral membrane protein (TIGR00698 family)